MASEFSGVISSKICRRLSMIRVYTAYSPCSIDMLGAAPYHPRKSFDNESAQENMLSMF